MTLIQTKTDTIPMNSDVLLGCIEKRVSTCRTNITISKPSRAVSDGLSPDGVKSLWQRTKKTLLFLFFSFDACYVRACCNASVCRLNKYSIE